MSARTRRSGRERKVNPRYANDGWDKDTLRILRASSESSGSSPDDDQGSENAEIVEQDDEGSFEEDEGASSASDVRSQFSDVQDPNEDEDNMSLASDDQTMETPRLQTNRGRSGTRDGRGGVGASTTTPTHSRGLARLEPKGAKGLVYRHIFGPELDDLEEVLAARDTWLLGRDVTLPSRKTLSVTFQRADQARRDKQSDPSKEPKQHLHPPRLPESVVDLILNQQLLKPIEPDELYERYLHRHKPSHSVVLGPFGRQQLYTLDYNLPMDFGWAWPKVSDAGRDQTSQTSQRYHEGWLVNAGEKINCLAWAPQQQDAQYLAVATRCTSHQRQLAGGNENMRPAFHPSPPYPSSIQIWAFPTKPTSAPGLRTIAMNLKPKLCTVIGTEYGNIRAMKWCPSTQNPPSTFSTGAAFIGILAILCTDGSVHVLAIPSQLPTPITLKAERSGLTFSPPGGTVFTTLTFATSTDLVIGAADGTVHLFDLSDPTGLDPPRSYTSPQIHSTYITSLSAASPVHLTPFIATASSAGDMALTDLRSPTQDKVTVTRACFPSRDIYFAPFTRSFITGLDRVGSTRMDTHSAAFLACHHVRQFHSSLRLAKLPDHSGTATALSGSPHHPCILVGNAKGQVHATNYLRKILPYRRTEPGKRVMAFLQKLCEYDWRPAETGRRDDDDDDDTDVETHHLHHRQRQSRTAAADADARQHATRDKPEQEIDLFHGHDVRPGVSRFHEGFKPERINLAYVPDTKKKGPSKDTWAAETIFEEEQAVTVLEWNPNESCAGMAAVGWASGMVRVQDLAHDLE
ncbi:hypothetical protein PV08_09345 [Exophiala spinifera]|uniref:Uncharacterized protein n=1 Tax=Exophiala spinifera TaxID=91928 RepID=A0A0D1YAY8_9EURO|nr:uncharacterized protein PV08_09345 [Exophiala spinifera]KIW12071.1 hypothetical protein PV08_09345 [Exophiala spinifera]